MALAAPGSSSLSIRSKLNTNSMHFQRKSTYADFDLISTRVPRCADRFRISRSLGTSKLLQLKASHQSRQGDISRRLGRDELVNEHSGFSLKVFVLSSTVAEASVAMPWARSSYYGTRRPPTRSPHLKATCRRREIPLIPGPVGAVALQPAFLLGCSIEESKGLAQN